MGITIENYPMTAEELLKIVSPMIKHN